MLLVVLHNDCCDIFGEFLRKAFVVTCNFSNVELSIFLSFDFANDEISENLHFRAFLDCYSYFFGKYLRKDTGSFQSSREAATASVL